MTALNYPDNYPSEPASIWRHFYQFTQIPRPSGKEEKIRQYLLSVAENHELKSQVDAAGNIIIYVPGKGLNKDHDTIIIQNHIDMVTDKIPSHLHNFETDPLKVFVKDGWISAYQTTLGADNGIGCAAALSLLDTADLDHPPLELLFTVDEETGLNGALGLQAHYLSGKKLINLDTEEWGSAYIGCAGGMEYELNGSYQPDNSVQANSLLKIGGLKGGHSGIDIHRGRVNAIKLIAQILQNARKYDVRISELSGGKAHNIIPRDAQVSFYLPERHQQDFTDMLANLKTQWSSFFNQEDLEFSIKLQDCEPSACLSSQDSDAVIHLLSLFPHGARDYYWEPDEPLVRISNNLANIQLRSGKLYLQTSIRFFDRHEAQALEQMISALSTTFALKIKSSGFYPSWKPDFDNSMLNTLKAVYEQNFNEKLQIKAIHAGLECGILKDKLGDELEAISFGPTITGAHSPTESLEIESTRKFWQLLVQYLKVL
jgi:dipeptidase D